MGAIAGTATLAAEQLASSRVVGELTFRLAEGEAPQGSAPFAKRLQRLAYSSERGQEDGVSLKLRC